MPMNEKRERTDSWDDGNFKTWLLGENGKVTGPDDLLDDVCGWINESGVAPEQVFDASHLEAWAENNGFVSEGHAEELQKHVEELKEKIEELQGKIEKLEDEALYA